MMFVASFLTFMAIVGFPSFVEEMKVFERERLNGHYGVTPFGIGNTLSALPFLALVALIPDAITYFLPGLHHRYQHFLFFVIILFACMMLVESLMMIVASVVPNILMGIIVGDGIQGIMILVCGFFRLPTDLPKPLLKYPFYHIVFHKYAYQGLFKNEFLGLTSPNAEAGNGGSPTITGEEILKQTWHFETAYSKWVDLAILFAMVVFYRVLFLIVMKTTEKVKLVMVKFMSATRKERTQVTVNPSATPSATPYCADKRQWQ
ncbi:ABC transporter G family member 1-like [Gossypium raimondii]|nr:ABC transporter G family member 1-like [Gossypium raimondii]